MRYLNLRIPTWNLPEQVMRFLSEEEIFNLTGHKTASKQTRWLHQNGINHWINSKNKVQITDTSIELALQHNKPVISTPNFAALERSSRI